MYPRIVAETLTLIWCGYDGEPCTPQQTVAARVCHRNAALVYLEWLNPFDLTESRAFNISTGWPDDGQPTNVRLRAVNPEPRGD